MSILYIEKLKRITAIYTVIKCNTYEELNTLDVTQHIDIVNKVPLNEFVLNMQKCVKCIERIHWGNKNIKGIGEAGHKEDNHLRILLRHT